MARKSRRPSRNSRDGVGSRDVLAWWRDFAPGVGAEVVPGAGVAPGSGSGRTASEGFGREGARLRAVGAAARGGPGGRCPLPRSRQPLRCAPPRRAGRARAPGSRVAAGPAAALRHLRQRPGHRRRPRQPWFEPIVSFPFVPGHEVVGGDRRRPAGGDRAGARLCGAGHRPAVPARAPAATSAAASGSRSATSRPGCRPASARTPAAAGAPRSSPTPRSSTTCRRH